MCSFHNYRKHATVISIIIWMAVHHANHFNHQQGHWECSDVLAIEPPCLKYSMTPAVCFTSWWKIRDKNIPWDVCCGPGTLPWVRREGRLWVCVNKTSNYIEKEENVGTARVLFENLSYGFYEFSNKPEGWKQNGSKEIWYPSWVGFCLKDRAKLCFNASVMSKW